MFIIVLIVVAALFALFVIYAIIDGVKSNKFQKEFIDDLKTMHGFDFAYAIIRTQSKKVNGFLLDNGAKKIVIVRQGTIKIYDFSDLISFQISTDTETKAQTKGRSDKGLLSDAVHKGTIKTTTSVKGVKVELIFDDMDDPVYSIDLMKDLYISEQKAVDEASKINGYLNVIIHKNQKSAN
jgi:hypothetical protein